MNMYKVWLGPGKKIPRLAILSYFVSYWWVDDHDDDYRDGYDDEVATDPCMWCYDLLPARLNGISTKRSPYTFQTQQSQIHQIRYKHKYKRKDKDKHI